MTRIVIRLVVLLVAVLLSGALWPLEAEAAAPPLEPLRMKVVIHTLDGWFNTFSRPGEATWTFDMAALQAEKEHGKIEFKRSDDDEGWYFPYRGRFRVDKQATDAGGWSMVRLVNEDHGQRTTITLSRHGPKENFEWRGFFVFEQTDGPILGVFSFKNVAR